MKAHWALVGVVIGVAVIAWMITHRPSVTAGTPTLSYKPAQPATGGVVSNVATAVASSAPDNSAVVDDDFNADY